MYFYNGMAAYAGDKESLKILEKLLVSDVMWSYIENKSKHYASGYFGLGKNYLKDFGIYDFTDDEIDFLLNENDSRELNNFFNSKYLLSK